METRQEKIAWLTKNVLRPTIDASIENHPQINDAEDMVAEFTRTLTRGLIIETARETWEEVYTDEDLDALIVFYQTQAGLKTIQVSKLVAQKTTKKLEAITTLADAFKAG